MKAIMSENGVITLRPETTIEAFALKQWAERTAVIVEDTARGESCYIRGSMLIVDCNLSDDKEGA